MRLPPPLLPLLDEMVTHPCLGTYMKTVSVQASRSVTWRMEVGCPPRVRLAPPLWSPGRGGNPTVYGFVTRRPSGTSLALARAFIFCLLTGPCIRSTSSFPSCRAPLVHGFGGRKALVTPGLQDVTARNSVRVLVVWLGATSMVPPTRHSEPLC